MFSWLTTIRSKPTKKKRLAAFGISLFITGLIFIVWLSVWLPIFFHGQDLSAKNDQFETPKDSFMQSFGATWTGITGQFGVLKNMLGNLDVSKNLSSAVQYQSTSTDATSTSSIDTSRSTSTTQY